MKEKQCKESADVEEMNNIFKKIDDHVESNRKERETVMMNYETLNNRVQELTGEQEALRNRLSGVEHGSTSKLNKLKYNIFFFFFFGLFNSCTFFEDAFFFRWDCQLYQAISKIKWNLETDLNEFSGSIL